MPVLPRPLDSFKLLLIVRYSICISAIEFGRCCIALSCGFPTLFEGSDSMSAHVSLRIGVIAAGLSCLLLGYAAAEQETSGQARSERSNAAGQSDRSSTQQSDRATTQRNDRTYGTSQRRTANYRGENAVGGQNQAVERYLAGCLLAHNQSEVQLGEFAQQKAESPDVKQFAQELVKDHRQLTEKLQPLAGMYGGANHGVSGSFGARTESERTKTSGTSTNPTASPAIGSTSESASNVATTERSVPATAQFINSCKSIGRLQSVRRRPLVTSCNRNRVPSSIRRSSGARLAPTSKRWPHWK